MVVEAKNKTVGMVVTLDMYNIIKRVVESLNLISAEYLRLLVIQDLEKRRIITTKLEKLKEEIKNV